MHDDSQFIAAAKAAISIIDLYGNVPGEQRAMSVGIVTFLLLDLLKAQGKANP